MRDTANAKPARRQRRSCSGQATVETIGYLPYVLVMFLMAIEAFAYVMTMEEVDSAARAGARVASQGSLNGRETAYEALPGRLHDEHTHIRVTANGGQAEATVTAQVPLIFNAPIDWTVTRTVTMSTG